MVPHTHEAIVFKACSKVEKNISQMLGLEKGDAKALEKIVAMEITAPGKLAEAWVYLSEFYSIVAVSMFHWNRQRMGLPDNFHLRPLSMHLSSIIQNGITYYIPDALETSTSAIERLIERSYLTKEDLQQ